jgi:hypothetical protein
MWTAVCENGIKIKAEMISAWPPALKNATLEEGSRGCEAKRFSNAHTARAQVIYMQCRYFCSIFKKVNWKWCLSNCVARVCKTAWARINIETVPLTRKLKSER